MTELLEQAIARLREIDEVDQNYWAWRIVEGLEADRKWDEMIESPEGQRVLEMLVVEAEADIAARTSLSTMQPLPEEERREAPSLAEMIEQITPENRHPETDWGPPVGKEVW